MNTARNKPPQIVLRTIAGIRACGHADQFKVLANERPDWAARRREKWNAKQCAACGQIAQEKQQAEAAARRAARPGGVVDLFRLFRLPDGSTITLSYRATDATHGMWTGMLIADGRTIQAENDGVHRLLRALGRQWKASMAALAPVESPAEQQQPEKR